MQKLYGYTFLFSKEKRGKSILLLDIEWVYFVHLFH